MAKLNVSLQITLLCSMIITQITRKLDTFMLRLNMSLKTTLCCSLIITLIVIHCVPRGEKYHKGRWIWEQREKDFKELRNINVTHEYIWCQFVISKIPFCLAWIVIAITKFAQPFFSYVWNFVELCALWQNK